MADLTMSERIRAVIREAAVVPASIDALADDQDLYEAGLTSFGSVQLMLALEVAFDVEFPERLLTRRTFGSVLSIERSMAEIARQQA
jgi:acyl carrier protein